MYLKFLGRYCRAADVRIGGYYLMGNHVHPIAVPARADGLAKALGRTHNDYARWFNMRRGETGHVWQNRFYSCPLEEWYRWAALRHVELNPVRAGLTREASEWRWSSAAAHLGGADPTGVLDVDDWSRQWTSGTWRDALERGLEEAALRERIREATRTGRPAGSGVFLDELEKRVGRSLRPQKRGPKVKVAAADAQLNLGVS